jgi:cysteine-rich repeat protein
MAFVSEHASIFGLRDPAVELELVREFTDGIGFSHVFYRQVYSGVPVFGSDFRSHFNSSGQLTAVNAVTVPIRRLDPSPRIKIAAAVQIAIEAVTGARKQQPQTPALTAENSELLVFRTGLLQGVQGSNHLAYRVEVINANRTIREFVFVDAHDGAVLDQITGIHHAIDRQVYDGGFNENLLVWSEGDELPFNGQNQSGINDLINYAEDTYNLFMTLSNGAYPSFDGADATMHSVLNPTGINCPNATWNGVSTNYCNGVTADDTVAHEWGHAYTDFTHDLIYQWQSGALNESYSDIFGEIVDLLNGAGTDSPITARTADGSACSIYGSGSPATDDSFLWLSGEDDPAFGGAIRDMWRPECYNHPGKVSSNSYFCSAADSGGVHFNSGVPNHAFALMVDGGTYNDQTITGLGLTKATHIYWRAMSVYQGPASNFPDHADSLAASCSDLVAIDLPALSTDTATPSLSGEMITEADCIEVDEVITAVEFDTDPEQCGFESLLETNPPQRCAGYGALQSFSFTDWESGLGAWTVGRHDVVNEETFDTPDWSVVGDLPDEREGLAAFVPDLIYSCADLSDDQTGALNLDSPLIEIPAGTLVPRISVDHFVATEVDWDGGNFKISINGGAYEIIPGSAIEVSPYNKTLFTSAQQNTNPLQGQEAFTGADGGAFTGSWGQSHVNLLGIAEAGDTVQLRFDFGIDVCFGAFGWYVDEVEFYRCSAEPLPSPCGNGMIDGIEACDDGNDFIGDGCSSSCQVESGWECTLPAGVGEVADPGFESGTPNSFWAETSTNFGTPLCDATSCGSSATIGPSEGTWWAWFGGILGFEEVGSVSQSITIPVGASELEFDFQANACDSAADFIELTIDGNQEFFVDGTSLECGAADYNRKSVEISAYADGGSHEIAFNSTSNGTNGGTANFFVDDVGIPGNVSECTQVFVPLFIDSFENPHVPPLDQ